MDKGLARQRIAGEILLRGVLALALVIGIVLALLGRGG